MKYFVLELRRKFFTILVSLLLLSCGNSLDIEGVWVSFNNGVNGNSYGRYDGVVSFTNNSMLIKGLGLPDDGLDPFEKSFKKKSDLIYSEGSLNVQVEKKSETVLKLNFIKNNENIEVYYHKLPKQTISQKSRLRNNSYICSHDDKIIKYLNFVNDSICIEFYPEKETFNTLRWNKFTLKNHEFLVLKDKVSPYQLVIDSIQENNIFLSSYTDIRRTLKYEYTDIVMPRPDNTSKNNPPPVPE